MDIPTASIFYAFGIGSNNIRPVMWTRGAAAKS